MKKSVVECNSRYLAQQTGRSHDIVLRKIHNCATILGDKSCKNVTMPHGRLDKQVDAVVCSDRVAVYTMLSLDEIVLGEFLEAIRLKYPDIYAMVAARVQVESKKAVILQRLIADMRPKQPHDQWRTLEDIAKANKCDLTVLQRSLITAGVLEIHGYGLQPTYLARGISRQRVNKWFWDSIVLDIADLSVGFAEVADI